ncbi:hypothetical protein GCM10027419_11100 [Pandoraea terrae]
MKFETDVLRYRPVNVRSLALGRWANADRQTSAKADEATKVACARMSLVWCGAALRTSEGTN